MFAAQNTVEPPILELHNASLYETGKPCAAERQPLVDRRVQLAAHLAATEWLGPAFGASDPILVSVRWRVKSVEMLAQTVGWPPT